MAGITDFAAAFAAARALRDRTWAGARVLLEPAAPVAIAQPTICVYRLRGHSRILHRALLEGKRCRIRIELFLPPSVEATDGTTVVTIDVGASAALAFALFWRQCEIALNSDQSAWADLFRALVVDSAAIETSANPFETVTTGATLAARAFEWVGYPINGPRIGVEPEGVWADWLAALRSEGGEFASIADLVRSQIIGGASLGDWRSDLALLGLSQSYGPPLGLAPQGDVNNQPGAAQIEAPADPILNPQQN